MPILRDWQLELFHGDRPDAAQSRAAVGRGFVVASSIPVLVVRLIEFGQPLVDDVDRKLAIGGEE